MHLITLVSSIQTVTEELSLLISSVNICLFTISRKFIRLLETTACWKGFTKRPRKDRGRWSHLFEYVGQFLEN